MGELLHIINNLHKKTKREYLPRMNENKVEAMTKAREFGKDFWDGDRRYGYGGYVYDGRWKPIAEMFIKTYQLNNQSKVLDVGCGKGFLLYEIKSLLPGIEIAGFDVSEYAIKNSKEEIRDFLFVHKAQDIYPYGDKYFDLVISNLTLHNLYVYELKIALQEIERVGKQKYISVESYRNIQELFNLQCWALTCKAFFSTGEWIWLFKHFGYTGDYEFIYFE